MAVLPILTPSKKRIVAVSLLDQPNSGFNQRDLRDRSTRRMRQSYYYVAIQAAIVVVTGSPRLPTRITFPWPTNLRMVHSENVRKRYS